MPVDGGHILPFGEIHPKIFLDLFAGFILSNFCLIQVLILSLIGNSVKIGDGPAAVIEDEHRRMSLSDGSSEACEKVHCWPVSPYFVI
jgi:hypothetical protein